MKRYGKASEVKVAAIGYGGAFNMGRQHLGGCRDAGMTPWAAVDPDPSRLEAAKKDWPGIETYDSLSAMLKKSEANLAILITPHNTHADLAVKCLKAGCHVVSEKPFAITTAECDRMIAAAKKNRAMLSTYHNRHWDGCILDAVKNIRSGIIGVYDQISIADYYGRSLHLMSDIMGEDVKQAGSANRYQEFDLAV